MSKNTNKSRRSQALIRILIVVGILICVNVLASYLHRGLDLTREKRFTLTEPTIKLLKSMKEVAVIDVYLQSDHFPADLQRMHEAVLERLRSFKDVAGNKIIFRFTDPFKDKSEAEKAQLIHDFAQKGMQVREFHMEDEASASAQLYFPYAFIQYNGHEMPLFLLDNKVGGTRAEKVNYSESLLEYKFANALNQMNMPEIPRVAYVRGNKEPWGVEAYDMLSTLSARYILDTSIFLDKVRQISPYEYQALIIMQPDTTFTGPEKYVLDQYIMHGGHVLLVLNNLEASLDSLILHPPQFIAMPKDLQLDDMLFKYGVRINNDLVEDGELNLKLPRTVNSGEPELHDWIYFPRLNPTADHPIVRNMDFIRAGFTNSIDTIRTATIKKTILLTTSKHSLKAGAPVRVSLSMMNYKPQDQMFTKSYIPVAVLLEGKFVSAFQNKLAPEFLKYLNDSLKQPFKPYSEKNPAIIVTSVGDIFLNGRDPRNGMGYYWGTHEFFANRDFLLNCVQYLTDTSGILEARSKESKLRLLDASRARDEKTKWQVVNIAIPISIVLIFASAYLFFRKRRYETSPTIKS